MDFHYNRTTKLMDLLCTMNRVGRGKQQPNAIGNKRDNRKADEQTAQLKF